MIEVRPKGFVSATIVAESGGDTSGPRVGSDRPVRWLPVINPLPNHENPLFVLDLDSPGSSTLVARSKEVGRISDARVLAQSDTLLLRAKGRLFLWRPGHVGVESVPLIDNVEEAVLGEIAVSEDDTLLATASGARDRVGMGLFLVHLASPDSPSRLPVYTTGSVWIRNLEFSAKDRAIRVDALSPGDRKACSFRILLSDRETPRTDYQQMPSGGC